MTEKNKAVCAAIVTIAKYLVALFIVIYIVLLFLFTGGSTKPFNEIADAIESSLDLTELKNFGDLGLKRYFGLNGADYEGVMYYHSQNNLSAEEVLLIKVKDKAQVPEIQHAVEKRLKSCRNDFDGYDPKQARLIDEAHLSVRGKYIFLAVGPKAQEYQDIFSKSL